VPKPPGSPAGPSPRRPRLWAPLAAFAFLACASLGASGPPLAVVYQGRTVEIAAAELSAMAHQEVTAFDAHEKRSHAYSGVPVRDLLARAGLEFGEKLRGRALRLAVLVHCRDHYDVVFALAEFDDSFNGRTILLADLEDGRPLPDALGPLRLVVPGDKRVARWARMVTSIEVIAVGSD
jgi:DMSO/TMAO reductase YedYZ molybdopterin-dependent catalytic subunit